MPAIRDAVGGFEARDDIQIASGAAQNCYPEILEAETEFLPRRRVAMLPTRGFRRYAKLPNVITGLSGTRELEERLAVASGRTLRLYKNPDADPVSPASISLLDADALESQTLYPVLGAYSHAGSGAVTFYACLDGRIRVFDNSRGSAEVSVVYSPADDEPHVTPRGLTGTNRITTGIRQGVLWFSCVEDRRVYAWSINRSGGTYSLARYESLDLVDVIGDTAVVQPESLYYHQPAGIGATRGVIAVADAIGGEVYLFELDTDPGGSWMFVSQDSVRNTFSLQLVNQFNAEEPDRMPALPGGVHLDSDSVRIVDRRTEKIYRFSRGTGAQIGAPADIPARVKAVGVPGGFTGGQLYVDGGQAPAGGVPTRVGGLYGYSSGTKAPGVDLADEAPDAGSWQKTPLLPLDDTGRFLAWLVDRQLNIVDLPENRLIPRVAGDLDSIARSGNRLVGCSAAKGQIRVSPPHMVIAREADRLGVIDAGAQIVIHGRGISNPNPARWAYFGARYALIVTSGHDLFRYDRSDIEKPPVQLGSGGIFSAIGTDTLGRCVLVFRELSTNNVNIRIYDIPPETNAEVARRYTDPVLAARVAHGIADANLGFDWDKVVDVAATETHLFVLGDTDTYAVSLTPGFPVVSGFSRMHLASIWGVPDGRGYDNVVALDASRLSVRGVATDVIRAAVTSSTADPQYAGTENQGRAYETLLQALTPLSDGTGFINQPSLNITANVNQRPYSLTHDSKYLYECDGVGKELPLRDGTPSLAVSFAAFLNVRETSRSQYRWEGAGEIDGSHVLASLRGTVYAFTPSSLRIYQPDPDQAGFPFSLQAVRDVGICGPHAFGVIKETLFWFDRSGRLWQIMRDGDTTPEPVVSAAAEDALRLVAERNTASGLSDGVGLTLDAGGHPVFICSWRKPGLTLAYDSESEEWHTRTSRRFGDGPFDKPFSWQDPGQGAWRVEHSANWRGRQFYGGYGRDGAETADSGIVAEESLRNWQDIDGGPVQRVRQFGGVDYERRLVKYPVVRVDVTYAHNISITEPYHEYLLRVSNDGGKTFGNPRRRRITNRPPRPFYGLGSSRYRIFRIESSADIPFSILGVFHEPAGVYVGRKA